MRVPGRSPKRSRASEAPETVPMDPVALTLAVWLGLIACVTGVIRLSENAAVQAAIARGGEMRQQQVDVPRNFALGN